MDSNLKLYCKAIGETSVSLIYVAEKLYIDTWKRMKLDHYLIAQVKIDFNGLTVYILEQNMFFIFSQINNEY